MTINLLGKIFCLQNIFQCSHWNKWFTCLRCNLFQFLILNFSFVMIQFEKFRFPIL